MEFWLIFALLGTFSAGIDCDTWKCNELNPDQRDLCVFMADGSTTHLMRVCDDGYTCNTQITKDEKTVICTFPEPYRTETSFANVGEPCIYDVDCIQHCSDESCYKFTCEDSVCQGKQKGATCSVYNDYDECNPGLFCKKTGDSAVCHEQVPKGGLCENDHDCVNDCGCDQPTNDPGKCIVYNSISAKATVEQCNITTTQIYGTNPLCKSGMCWKTDSSNHCSTLLKTDGDLPMHCTNSTMCKSEEETSFESEVMHSECKCSKGVNGQSYCDLHPGDDLYVQFAEQHKKWINSDAISKCVTRERFGVNCMKSYWNRIDYLRYMFLHYGKTEYPMNQDNDECVKKILQSTYYGFEKAYLDAIAKQGNVAKEILS